MLSINKICPVIGFTEEAYNKMWALVDHNDKEIGWHGTVEHKDNAYLITDILVYPQTVTAASIRADETKFNDWMLELAISPEDTFDKLRFHGHSHVNMSVSPSTVDLQLQEDTLAQIKDDDFYIFFIVNKSRAIWCRLYDKKTGLIYETNDVEIISPKNPMQDWAEKTSKENIIQPKKVTRKTPYNRHSNGLPQNKAYQNYYYGTDDDDMMLYDDEYEYYKSRRNK